jgi:hypothetical protein
MNVVEVIKNVSTTGTITFTPIHTQYLFRNYRRTYNNRNVYLYRGVLTLGGTEFSQAQAGGMPEMSGMSGMDSNNHIV